MMDNTENIQNSYQVHTKFHVITVLVKHHSLRKTWPADEVCLNEDAGFLMM